jgi:uncharacterized damage-inducible protein DinB
VTGDLKINAEQLAGVIHHSQYPATAYEEYWDMNADAFRHLFNYHFAENRKLLDEYLPQLSEEQFRQESGYSHGSVRNQIVHLMSVDETWSSGLRGSPIPEPLDPKDFPDKASIRSQWEIVEQNLHAYLSQLHDDMLNAKPLEGEDKDLKVWQVLLQVVNHGTDHRAQILRSLNDLGVKTTSQDYIFYAYDNP